MQTIFHSRSTVCLLLLCFLFCLLLFTALCTHMQTATSHTAMSQNQQNKAAARNHGGRGTLLSRQLQHAHRTAPGASCPPCKAGHRQLARLCLALLLVDPLALCVLLRVLRVLPLVLLVLLVHMVGGMLGAPLGGACPQELLGRREEVGLVKVDLFALVLVLQGSFAQREERGPRVAAIPGRARCSQPPQLPPAPRPMTPLTPPARRLLQPTHATPKLRSPCRCTREASCRS